MIRMIAMVSSTSTPSLTERGCNLGAFVVRLVRSVLLCWIATGVASPAAAQAPQTPRPPSERPAAVSAATFIAGAALGLAMHESGHLLFDVLFDADPGTARVSYAGIPFFAITHRPVSPVREFTISSAGFWVQHGTSEILLTRRPRLRDEQAPLMKGILAFNVITSGVYAGAAFARTGPAERDTRGIAVSARIAEPWVGAAVLGPAVLDAARYFKPESRALRWASRAMKVGGVLLVLKAR